MKISALIHGSALACLPALVNAWLPADGKMRGVNLGSWLITEPWMMSEEWNQMGCGGQNSEFDCTAKLGQGAANAAFKTHWESWITKEDITKIASLGLNTIRIPLGYWIFEDIVYQDSEHFPQGGFTYLERVCGWAKDSGLYIILDLHGAPGAQQARQPFTGQYAPTAGFYVDYQYERAYKFLEWITKIIHTNPNFSNVGAVEIVNEPTTNKAIAATMIAQYYPTAFTRIRAVEKSLNIAANNYVHIKMMDERWGSGDPTSKLTNNYFALYGDHDYVKYTPNVPLTRAGYMQHSCTDSHSGNSPLVTSEWSLSVADSVQWNSEFTINAPDAVEWYRKWWGAQVLSYEKNMLGWIYWSWKVSKIGGTEDWRWGYEQAFDAGVIPKNPLDVYKWGVCDGIS